MNEQQNPSPKSPPIAASETTHVLDAALYSLGETIAEELGKDHGLWDKMLLRVEAIQSPRYWTTDEPDGNRLVREEVERCVRQWLIDLELDGQLDALIDEVKEDAERA